MHASRDWRQNPVVLQLAFQMPEIHQFIGSVKGTISIYMYCLARKILDILYIMIGDWVFFFCVCVWGGIQHRPYIFMSSFVHLKGGRSSSMHNRSIYSMHSPLFAIRWHHGNSIHWKLDVWYKYCWWCIVQNIFRMLVSYWLQQLNLIILQDRFA